MKVVKNLYIYLQNELSCRLKHITWNDYSIKHASADRIQIFVTPLYPHFVRMWNTASSACAFIHVIVYGFIRFYCLHNLTISVLRFQLILMNSTAVFFLADKSEILISVKKFQHLPFTVFKIFVYACRGRESSFSD